MRVLLKEKNYVDFPTEGEMMTVRKLSKDFMLELCGAGKVCVDQAGDQCFEGTNWHSSVISKTDLSLSWANRARLGSSRFIC